VLPIDPRTGQPVPLPTGTPAAAPAPAQPISFPARLYPANDLASGAGNRGSFLSCRYTMNSTTLGTGTCQLNHGAVFTMHVGN
jgi:hypothetical protein